MSLYICPTACTACTAVYSKDLQCTQMAKGSKKAPKSCVKTTFTSLALCLRDQKLYFDRNINKDLDSNEKKCFPFSTYTAQGTSHNQEKFQDGMKLSSCIIPNNTQWSPAIKMPTGHKNAFKPTQLPKLQILVNKIHHRLAAQGRIYSFS